MGGSESTLSNLEGFQIVRVKHNSPAHAAGLVPFFDFITAIDDLPLERDNQNFFFDYVGRNRDKSVRFRVFSLRIRANRDLEITPTDCWGGVGLLGCNVNWENVEHALSTTWHIVEVASHSPAFEADLMAHRDFVLGMQAVNDQTIITLFKDSSDFHGRLEDWRVLRAANPRSAPRQLLLLIYNAVENSVKEILVDMGKSGSLGIDVANGYIHVVPAAPGTDNIPSIKRFIVCTQPGTGGGSSPLAPEPIHDAPPPATVPAVQEEPPQTTAAPTVAPEPPSRPSLPTLPGFATTNTTTGFPQIPGMAAFPAPPA